MVFAWLLPESGWYFAKPAYLVFVPSLFVQRHMKRAVKRKENARAGQFYTAVREVNDVMRKILVRGSRRGGF